MMLKHNGSLWRTSTNGVTRDSTLQVNCKTQRAIFWTHILHKRLCFLQSNAREFREQNCYGLEDSIVKYDDSGDDREIAHSNDDFEMSHPSPVPSSSALLENTESISSKMAVFWVVAPCSLIEFYRHFRGTCCLHHQGLDDEGSKYPLY
jgi:hypothetical protein